MLSSSSCRHYSTLRWPTLLLNRDSHGYEGSASCKISSLHPQPVTHENRMMEFFPHTLGFRRSNP